MKIGSKVGIIEEFDCGIVTLEVGDTLTVANYIHKQKLFLKANGVADLIAIKCDDIEKYIKVINEYSDPLAELEAVVLAHYLDKGYKLFEELNRDDESWFFEVTTETKFKVKSLNVFIYVLDTPIMKDSYYGNEYETTKEMFDEAIKYFRKVS